MKYINMKTVGVALCVLLTTSVAANVKLGNDLKDARNGNALLIAAGRDAVEAGEGFAQMYDDMEGAYNELNNNYDILYSDYIGVKTTYMTCLEDNNRLISKARSWDDVFKRTGAASYLRCEGDGVNWIRCDQYWK